MSSSGAQMMFEELKRRIAVRVGRALAGCITALAIASAAHAQVPPADEWLAQPVDDATFATYLQFFEYNSDVPFDTRVLGQDTLDGIVVEHLTFQSTPGELVTALLYRPDVAGPEERALVLLHGGIARGKDAEWMKQISRLLARSGWVVLAIDMKHFGERATDLLQAFTHQEKRDRLYSDPSTYLGWMAQNVKDAGRSFDFLVEERGTDAGRIALVGFSRGAVVGTIVGGADERFAAVALILGGHIMEEVTGHLPAACPANYIGRVSPRPLLMVNGEEDVIFPMNTSVLPLQRLAGHPQEFRWTDSGHTVTEEDLAFLLRWLRESVP